MNVYKCHFRFKQPISCLVSFKPDRAVCSRKVVIMAHKDIYYSDKYTDDKYEYRYIVSFDYMR